MPSYDQKPGSLNFSFKRGDTFSAVVDFSPITMTGYTVTSSINSLVTGLEVQPLSVSFVSAADGRLNVGLTGAQTASLPAGSYGWSMRWVDGGVAIRTALSGVVEVL